MSIVSDSREVYDASGAINASALKYLSHPNTPAHFRAYMDEPRPAPTDAQRYGLILHRAIFEPDTIKGAFAVKPEGMSFATKEGKAWKLEHEDVEIISAKEATAIERTVKNVWAHPTAKKLLLKSDFERSIYATDENGVNRKGRLDVFPHSGNVLPDLKSCESAAYEDIEKQVVKYGYHYSAAFYLDLCEMIGQPWEHFVLICVEKTPPYLVALYEIQQEVIEWGRRQYERDLLIYRTCMASGQWPGFPEEVTQIGVPMFARKEMESMA